MTYAAEQHSTVVTVVSFNSWQAAGWTMDYRYTILSCLVKDEMLNPNALLSPMN
jgi:hypothetical protein